MKTFLTAIATLLLGVAATVPLGAQLSLVEEGLSDPSAANETITMDAQAIGHRVTKKLYLRLAGVDSTTSLRDIRVQGSNEFSYELKDVNRFPVPVGGEGEIDFFLFYLPQGPGPSNARLEITVRQTDSDLLPTDTVYSYTLVGRVPAFALSYMLPGGAAQPVPESGTVNFGHKPTGVATEATVVVRNVGSAPGLVEAIRTTGDSAYSLTAPPPLPARLEPGSFLNVQLAFMPPGTFVYQGQLQIDTGVVQNSYSLTGEGGDLLSFRVIRYESGAVTGTAMTTQSGHPIVFNSQAAVVEVMASNTRQGSQLVDQIRATGPFRISASPAVPANVGPGESFTVRVEPMVESPGDVTGNLIIGDAIFPLQLDVPPLPAVRFSSEGSSLRPGEQSMVGLSLAIPYPVDIDGTLQLDFDSLENANDPALQWSSGGRQVSFRIPAGQVSAEFSGGARMAEFQSAVSSGEIEVSARFMTDPWGINITPATAPTVTYMVDVTSLPEVSFSRAGGSVTAGQTLELGVGLAAPYPDAITGMLVLTFTSVDVDGAPGPWAGGRRQVSFQIPAGSTMAMFGGGADSMTSFAVPTVEGSLVVGAHFMTEDTGANLTPDPAPEIELSVEVQPLPAVRFSQSGGNVDAATQVPLEVSLASPYPVDIVGALNISFETRAFVTDPAVQWATGGRQAWFLILAGTTQAVFTGGAEMTAFQSGTVAGDVLVRGQFFAVPDGVENVTIQQAAGNSAEITPEPIPELRFSVREAAPTLRSVTIGSAQGGFSAVVTGYSTTRSVDTLNFTLSAAGGATLQTDQFTVDVSQSFATYYSGNQSAASGSQFSVTVSFRVEEGAFEDIRALSVTASNDLGTSNSVSADLN